MNSVEKSISGRGNSMSKGPGAGCVWKLKGQEGAQGDLSRVR